MLSPFCFGGREGGDVSVGAIRSAGGYGELRITLLDELRTGAF